MGMTEAIAPAPVPAKVRTPERRETSGVTSRLILSYVERERGRAGVDRLLAIAGLADDEDLLRDENHCSRGRRRSPCSTPPPRCSTTPRRAAGSAPPASTSTSPKA